MKEKRTTASRTIITTVALHYTVLVADRIHGGVAGMLIDNCPGNMRSDMASEGEGSGEGMVSVSNIGSVELRIDEKGKARSALAETSACRYLK